MKQQRHRTTGWLAIAGAAALAAGAACLGCSDGTESGDTQLGDAALNDTSSEPLCDKSISIEDPDKLQSQGPYLLVGFFEYYCPSEPTLAAGDLSGGIVYNYFPPSAACSYPATPHAIAVLVRDADCSVLAYGCTAADFAKSGDIAIELKAATQPYQGQCKAGAQCTKGDCKSSGDAGS
ncbi:MAG: hypothetical protein HY898_36120 [Deltaproteobacteria bacterium]|nr:hypothetical protein [Deltaproteobacteria bacterium]